MKLSRFPSFFQFSTEAKHRLFPLAAGAFILAASARAESVDTQPKAIQAAVAAGVNVVKTFPAASGLTGWVLEETGRHSIVFTTPDKKTLLAGALIDEKGENLLLQYEEKYLPKPDMAAAFAALEDSSYIKEGELKNPKSTIYVFVDANCPFCHLLWKALQPYERTGLQVRWIPVATLGPTSMPKAIEVLAASDQKAAFRKMEENHGQEWKENPQMSEKSKPEVAKKVHLNGKIMGAFGIAGTPGIVWKNKDGQISVKAGMPRLSDIPKITNMPEQETDDPALARFR